MLDSEHIWDKGFLSADSPLLSLPAVVKLPAPDAAVVPCLVHVLMRDHAHRLQGTIVCFTIQLCCMPFSVTVHASNHSCVAYSCAGVTRNALLTHAHTHTCFTHTYISTGPDAHALLFRLLCGLLVHWSPEVREAAGLAARRITAPSSSVLEPLLESLQACMNEPSCVAPLIVVSVWAG